MTRDSFDSCIKMINKGDEEGLRLIYEEYSTYIHAVMRSIAKNEENAADLTSDFFIKLWESSRKYRPGKGHIAWMTVIARNMAIDFMRKAGREELLGEVPEPAGPDNAAKSPEEEVIGNISFRDMVESLPSQESQIIAMKFAGDLTFREIAQIMKLPLGTVTWKYQRSIERLRRAVR
ncbi:MAG: sigma-70 family RNA polymerase sigma factor [Lachnospiraceae bacterium]|nr:sigma-70 family RNA polymerase sigma factor [Lachnospiraceae bacterium]